MSANVAKVEFARPYRAFHFGQRGVRVAINGLGTIGRAVVWAAHGARTEDFKLVALNDLFTTAQLAHALEHDSIYGHFPGEVVAKSESLEIDGEPVRVLAEKDPAKLPWKEMDVDIVIDATGRFLSLEGARKHLEAGAKKVALSAPHKEKDEAEIKTIVLGVNDDQVDASTNVFTNASCTTNCLAPMAKVLNDLFGLDWLAMTTDHAYTIDQRLQDAPHDNFRRARAAGLNLVITTTGAAKAVGLVFPALKGKTDGIAVRVPTPTVSLVDATVVLKREVTREELLGAFRLAAAGPLAGILAVEEKELVSKDFEGDPRSSIIDASATTVLFNKRDTRVKVFSWYDNVWGYSNRLRDLALLIAAKMQGLA